MTFDSGQSRKNINEESVLEYLNTTPLFFERNLEVLQSIKIPQSNGSVVSLSERQMTSLRAQNKILEKRLSGLLKLIEINQHLSEKVRIIILKLLKIDNISDCLEAFEKIMIEDFSATEAGLFLFFESQDKDILGRVKIDSLLNLGALLKVEKSILGPISNEQREAFFNSTGEENSAVILPLSGLGWRGAAIIVSDDRVKYQVGMASDFLEHLGEVLVLIVNRATRTSFVLEND